MASAIFPERRKSSGQPRRKKVESLRKRSGGQSRSDGTPPTLTLTLSRPTGEGTARLLARSFQSGWIRQPTEDDSPSPLEMPVYRPYSIYGTELASITGLNRCRVGPFANEWKTDEDRRRRRCIPAGPGLTHRRIATARLLHRIDAGCAELMHGNQQ